MFSRRNCSPCQRSSRSRVTGWIASAGVPLDCAMRWLAASRERRSDFLRRLLAAAERLAATFHEVDYQDERMAWQEERTGSNSAWSRTTRSWLIWGTRSAARARAAVIAQRGRLADGDSERDGRG